MQSVSFFFLKSKEEDRERLFEAKLQQIDVSRFHKLVFLYVVCTFIIYV